MRNTDGGFKIVKKVSTNLWLKKLYERVKDGVGFDIKEYREKSKSKHDVSGYT